MMVTGLDLSSSRERLVVVGEGNGQSALLEDFAARHLEWEVVRTETFLSGIAEVCRSHTRAIVALVESSQVELQQAVAGLREAGGSDARVVLCCRPEAEPAARAALCCGANEYIIQPVDMGELEAA